MLYYILAISVAAVIATLYDKAAAVKNGKIRDGRAKRQKTVFRVPERTLLLLGVAGGAAAMYITMLCIRHKTKHRRFMLGLPVIIVLQAACVAVICKFYGSGWLL